MENWYHLGLQLGVSENILDNIEYDHRGDVQTCKRKMVQTWLKQPRPSWNVLVESLSRVGEECAAVEALKNNAVGKLMYLNVNKLTHRFFVRHQLYYIYTYTVLELQKALLDKDNADLEITDDFIHKFSEAIGSRWPLLASLLSFTTAEIEQIKREVTGVPSVKAAAMMARWRERTTPTYGTLLEKVSQKLRVIYIIVLLASFPGRFIRLPSFYASHLPQ